MTRLKMMRLNRNLTQSEIEKRAQIAHWRFSLAERGLLLLSKQELHRLSRILQTSPQKLLENFGKGEWK